MAKKTEPKPEDDAQSRPNRPLRWIYPREVQDSQKVLVHVRGMAIVPYFPHHGDGWPWTGGQFVVLEAERVLNEQGALIGLQLGSYYISEEFLGHPRVTAMVEEKPDANPDAIPDPSLAGKGDQPCQEECASSKTSTKRGSSGS